MSNNQEAQDPELNFRAGRRIVTDLDIINGTASAERDENVDNAMTLLNNLETEDENVDKTKKKKKRRKRSKEPTSGKLPPPSEIERSSRNTATTGGTLDTDISKSDMSDDDRIQRDMSRGTHSNNPRFGRKMNKVTTPKKQLKHDGFEEEKKEKDNSHSSLSPMTLLALAGSYRDSFRNSVRLPMFKAGVEYKDGDAEYEREKLKKEAKDAEKRKNKPICLGKKESWWKKCMAFAILLFVIIALAVVLKFYIETDEIGRAIGLTNAPTTMNPTPAPVPTPRPTRSPTMFPSASPTGTPTKFPTQAPTRFPTEVPTNRPTPFPTSPSPTNFPTLEPTPFPTTASPTPFPAR